MSRDVSEPLSLRVLQALVEMQDEPHPAQASGEVAAHLSEPDVEGVYAALIDLVSDGLVTTGEREWDRGQPALADAGALRPRQTVASAGSSARSM